MRNLYLAFTLFILTLSAQAQLPEGFGVEPVIEDFESIAGIKFLNEDASLVWTFSGEVYSYVDGELSSEALIDISEEVGYWGDHGMLGFAIHPEFMQNGYIYLLYHVDTYHLLYSDSANYNPNADQNYKASIGRVTRFQLETEFPYEMVPGSRLELLGSDISNGIPQMSSSHGVGSLEFGSDNSLLVSCGDGSTWAGIFSGNPPYPSFAFDQDGLDWGIMRSDENLGAYRAQYTDTYCGKVLRIDPITGQGLSSNPFYEEDEPDSPRSKVWSLGLRNPFRIVHRPGTGSSDIEVGDPGSIYIGDVGYYTWEEINVANGPAMNFGWPRFEGMQIFWPYDTALTYHPHFANPLYDPSSCPIERYRFQDLIIQPDEDHNNEWGNPCDGLVEISDSLDLFVHERPAVAYSNQAITQPYNVLLPGFASGGAPIGIPVEEIPSVTGDSFEGIASVGGDFYYGTSFPEEYFGAYFQSDYSGWVKVFWFDENDQLVDFQHFTSDLGPILSTRFNPYDECMYVTSGFPSTISRICYEGNLRPNAIITTDTLYGPSPLTIQFDASDSWDPDEDPISYAWDFGDGSESTDIEPSHTFTSPDEAPTSFEVTLAVTDTAGNTDFDEVVISLNNTPPQVEITSLMDGGYYSVENTTVAELRADVYDAEFPDEELGYSWQTILHHNTHSHSNPFDHEHETSTVFEPAGCEEYATYYYRVTLTVEDPAGLSGYDEVTLFPQCDSVIISGPSFSEFILYPNPTSGSFTIRGPMDMEESIGVEIYDQVGRMVFSEDRVVDEFGRLGLYTPFFPDGSYILRLVRDSGSEVLRFIQR